MEWLRGEQDQTWRLEALDRCGKAPFIMPSEGFIGFLWDDSFYPGHRHQGLDIFSGKQSGTAPVYAAHAGYLTRLETWKSSLIIRIPDDPLSPGRQIWTYYTHLADSQGQISYIVPEFPPGTEEVYVEAGTLLGYQGNYSGDPGNPVGVHLHFSIVKDDGHGRFLNELEVNNTLDPSPYFGFVLNANHIQEEIPACPSGELNAES
jgi:murein DD-endopeptidase MepM/ murein hydrolase activator NlpD